MQKRIIVRITDKMSKQIEAAVYERNAKNTSELVRAALANFLKKAI